MTMKDAETVPATECEKLIRVASDSQKIGAFIDWMRERGWEFARMHSHNDCERENGYFTCGYCKDEFEPDRRSINTILAEYFEIDIDKVEAERRAILEAIRS